MDQGSVVLTNTTADPVAASITAVTDTGSSVHVDLTVGPRSAVAPEIPPAASGSWIAQTVVVDGGGVAVSQVVHDSSGWAEAPCLSSTSSRWYFPEGSTSGADQLFVALLNPTSTPVVADLSFVTPSGVVHPINYQGLVIDSGQLVVENVASEVQQDSTVSTIVSTRTGRVVASEVELVAAAGTTGARALARARRVRAAADLDHSVGPRDAGGFVGDRRTEPGHHSRGGERAGPPPSGPLAPLTAEVGPGATWVLATSAQTRIPAGVSYAAEVSARGGAGVVVGRRVSVPSSLPSPQDGAANAVGGLTAAAPTSRWVVPPPGTSTATPVSGAAPANLSLHNGSAAPERYRVLAVSGSSERTLAVGTVAAGATALVSGAPLAAAGAGQIFVRASGPMAVSEDVGPSGGIGVVTMPGIPLVAPIAGL